MNKQLIQNAYPVDNYVYELKFQHYSKFYQNVEDAFDAKLHSSEHPMIIRHPLNFTSLFYGAAESTSLRNENHMMDNDYLIDINSDDIEPKHAKLKENLLAMFRGTIYGIALISIFNFIYQIFF